MVMTSEIEFYLEFEFRELNYPDIHVHISSTCHFHGLRGHCGLKTA